MHRSFAALRMTGVLGVIAASLTLAGGFLIAAEAPTSPSELPAGPMQAKAVTACMECHEARIIVQQRLSKAAWTREVDKMIKWGAVVDSADRDALIDYFSSNFPPDKDPYVASPTTVAKKK